MVDGYLGRLGVWPMSQGSERFLIKVSESADTVEQLHLSAG